MKECVVTVGGFRYTFFEKEDVQKFQVTLTGDAFVADPKEKEEALKVIADYLYKVSEKREKKAPIIEPVEKPKKKKHAK